MTAIELLYKKYVRPRVFAASREDAEMGHEWGLRQLERIQHSPFLAWVGRRFLTYTHPMLETKVFGLHFPNPLGLAAGFDKYCKVYSRAVPACGWGSVEVGGITKDEQPGNDRNPPRMRRSEKLEALWNFMGFNNPGENRAAREMSFHPRAPIPVGLNVGKSKATPLDGAPYDYGSTIRACWPYVKYITLNPSSPNTPGLRDLQAAHRLRELVDAAQVANKDMALTHRVPLKPIGVKISPDLNDEGLADVVSVAREKRVGFLIVTNTTVSREGCDGWDIPPDRGGVSGPPLEEKAGRMIRMLRRELKGSIPLIGVGGIRNADTLFQRILDGADLCQAYTAWPFEGPDFVKRCLKGLVRRLKSRGFKNVREAVGTAL